MSGYIINPYIISGIKPWDLTSITYNSVTRSMASITSGTARGCYWAGAGSYLFTLTTGTDERVQRWDASTAYDVSSLPGSPSQDVSVSSDALGDIWVKDDGSELLFTAAGAQDVIDRRTFGTNYDLSTLAAGGTFDFSAQIGNHRAIDLSPDGTKLIAGDIDAEELFEYTLSTPFVLSTRTYTGNSIANPFGGVGNLEGAFYGDSGNKVFLTDGVGAIIERWNLPTPYSLASASLDTGQVFDTTGQQGYPTMAAFDPTGTKMVITGTVSTAIHEYDL